MSYKKQIVVISVPISIENNSKLYELSIITKSKSKTKYASNILSAAILKEYKKRGNHGKGI